MRSIVIHYQEIALKGKNRPWFIGRLVRHVKLAMADLDVREVRSIMGRIEVVLGPDVPWEVAKRAAAAVFGIANFAIARRTEPDLEALATALLRGSAGPGAGKLPRDGPARRQAVPDAVAGDRAPDRRARPGGVRLAGQAERSRAHHPRRVRHPRGVLLLRQGARGGRPAGRASAAGSCACCPAASIRPSPRGG